MVDLPDEKYFKAFRELLVLDEFVFQYTGEQRRVRSSNAWLDPIIVRELEACQDFFLDLLRPDTPNLNYSAKDPLNFTVDDILMRGGGDQFKFTPWSCLKNESKAGKFGPHTKQISSAFLRLVVGSYDLTRNDKREGRTREPQFNNHLQNIFQRIGLTTPCSKTLAKKGITERI